MGSKSRHNADAIVALEVSRSNLELAVLEPVGGDGWQNVRTRSIVWRNQARSLQSETGHRELTAALKTLVSAERLAGRSVRLVLSGDYCVTRVMAGTAEHVRRELDQLAQRAEHYIALGAGQKTLATSPDYS